MLEELNLFIDLQMPVGRGRSDAWLQEQAQLGSLL